jgi:formate hydrogenlyase subunit 3/multisubunit Na+/H+ antiporter MnhD subunit
LSPLSLAYLALACASASGIVSLGADRSPKLLRYGASLLLAGAGLAAIAAGAWSLLAELSSVDRLALGLPWLKWHLRLDPLSGFFFLVVGLLVFAVSLYAPGYLREFAHQKNIHSRAALGLFTALFILGMYLVLLADDAFVFMVAWELMSVSSYFLVAYQHQHAANRRAAFLYLLMAHVGGLAILLGFGVLAGAGGGFTFEHLRAAELSPAWASIAFALAFFGFGMKAGMVPLHAWLPEAHPAAPSHISALMSGVMLKVALYGFIRVTFDLIGDVQWAWGVAVLILGTASTLLGVLYALMQHNLKRLLAYHSVENIGIILMGLGLSLIFLSQGHTTIGILGFVAALYHTLNHALFKGLLFLGAGAVTHACHEHDLNNMGGLIRTMPQTAAFFLIGCLAISGLPPLNGFVSEWLTFQVALQGPALESGVLRSLIPITAAVLALSAALAAACFVKVYGVAFLGAPRSRRVGHAREVDIGMRAAMGLLAVLCIAFGVFPTSAIGALNAIPHMLFGQALPSATAGGWLWLTPVSPRVASYSAPLVFVAVVGIGALTFLFLHARRRNMRRGYPWDCGYGNLSPRMQYTATAFSMPIRRIFAPAWDIHEETEEAKHPTQPQIVSTIHHQVHVTDRSWSRVYEPIGRLVLAAARRIGVIQTGSIHTYLAYSFFTLLLLLWVVT